MTSALSLVLAKGKEPVLWFPLAWGFDILIRAEDYDSVWSPTVNFDPSICFTAELLSLLSRLQLAYCLLTLAVGDVPSAVGNADSLTIEESCPLNLKSPSIGHRSRVP